MERKTNNLKQIQKNKKELTLTPQEKEKKENYLKLLIKSINEKER